MSTDPLDEEICEDRPPKKSTPLSKKELSQKPKPVKKEVVTPKLKPKPSGKEKLNSTIEISSSDDSNLSTPGIKKG